MNRLIRDLYSQASAIFVVSNGVGESLQTDYHIDQHLIRTVYNPIGIADIIKKSHKKVEFPQIASGFKIVTLGRLTPQKDHSTLLRAFAQVKKNVYNAELIIIGEGSLLGELKRLSDELGIGECVWFAGWQENPFTIMSRCNLFVLSSKFEGFGNVIVEAMACGLPIISTDCQSGPAEILNHGEYGILTPVGDATALGNAIERLIKDRKLHAHYKRMSLKRSKDFDTPLIASKLIDFLIQRDHK